MKKQRTSGSSKQNPPDLDVSSVDAFDIATALRDAAPSVAALTTKHPRHRPGCTCIVCIQPPSGKGPRHLPNCTCNVCLTVKRQFKTLMMCKKKLQSQSEEEGANRRLLGLSQGGKEETKGSSTHKEREVVTEPGRAVGDDNNRRMGQLDLNCQSERDELRTMSMTSLVQMASRPLEDYLKQNGLTSLASEQQLSSSSATIPQAMAVDGSEERTPEADFEGSADEVRSS